MQGTHDCSAITQSSIATGLICWFTNRNPPPFCLTRPVEWLWHFLNRTSHLQQPGLTGRLAFNFSKTPIQNQIQKQQLHFLHLFGFQLLTLKSSPGYILSRLCCYLLFALAPSQADQLRLVQGNVNMWNVLGRGCGSLEAVLATMPKWISTRPDQTGAVWWQGTGSVENGPSKSWEIEETRIVMMMSGGMDFGGGGWWARPEPIHKCWIGISAFMWPMACLCA